MSRIAIVNVGMHGHVNPTLGFTEELIRRGHEVIYFTDAEFAPQVERTGAQLIDYGSSVGKQSAARGLAVLAGKNPWTVGGSFVEQRFKELEATLPSLLEHLGRTRPDVIVYSFISQAARLAAQRLGIPGVMFYTTYASNDHFDLISQMFSKHLQISAEETADLQARLDELTARHGVARLAAASLSNPPAAVNLVFMPRSFQPQGDTFDDRFHFVGPCLRATEPRLPAGLVPPGAAPLVLVSLGTVFNAWPSFYKDCLTAFGHKPYRVVMALGPAVDPATLGELPPNVSVRPHLPQLALLQQADLFVSHGGMNSTMEALYHGVPLVVIPQMEEQELTARRIDELSLGRFLHRDHVTAESLATAVSELLDSSKVRQTMDATQAEVRQSGGTSRAADLIERTAAGASDRVAGASTDTARSRNETKP
jgi:MGT family glycosyltransferase